MFRDLHSYGPARHFKQSVSRLGRVTEHVNMFGPGLFQQFEKIFTSMEREFYKRLFFAGTNVVT